MRVVHDDDDTLELIDEAAMTFMALAVHRLNAALVEGGVANSEKRQEICASFLFEFAYNHDAGWIEHEGRKLFPIVTFAERAEPAGDENLGKIDALHVPTPVSSWHEYAHGVVSQVFEEDNEDPKSIKFGSYQRDE